MKIATKGITLILLNQDEKAISLPVEPTNIKTSNQTHVIMPIQPPHHTKRHKIQTRSYVGTASSLATCLGIALRVMPTVSTVSSRDTDTENVLSLSLTGTRTDEFLVEPEKTGGIQGLNRLSLTSL